MTAKQLQLLTELERFGEDNDRAISDRPRRMLNITRDTGEFLSVLVRATNARRVLEIGTSNGYSTIWLADAARAIGGNVVTIELSEFKIALSAENFRRAGFSSIITQLHDEAGHALAGMKNESFDLIFLDSERTEYPGWWPDIRRVLRRGGLLVVDNATSHPKEMAPFVEIVDSDPEFTTCLATVGNGEFLATRSVS
ncbi:MAG TPA: O-methyltransferase [Dissulfurispiraceae bacterium]|nr:O-methyltransferase [Dissulfurispiraceae bacterium]